MRLQVGQKLSSYNLNPSVLGAPLEPRNAEVPRISEAIIGPLGPLLPGADPRPPLPNLSQQTSLPRGPKSAHRWRDGRQKGHCWGCPKPRYLGQEGTKGFQERTSHPLWSRRPPSPLLCEWPSEPPRRQVTGPEDPGRAGSGAVGRAKTRTVGLRRLAQRIRGSILA